MAGRRDARRLDGEPHRGRFGGGCIVSTNNTNTISTGNFFTCTGGIALAFWFKGAAPPAGSTQIARIQNGAGQFPFYLAVAPSTGVIQWFDRVSGIRTTGSINICDNNWHWVEALCSFNSAPNGNHGLYVDNVLQGSPSLNNDQGYLCTNCILSGGGSSTFSFDDIMVYDTAAGLPNQVGAGSPLSACQVVSRAVNSDGVCSFATLSAGTSHNALVSEVAADEDTTYVEDGTSGNQDLLGIAALGFAPSKIFGVMMNARLKVGGSGVQSTTS